MKTRLDFVSNSSSSSYIIAVEDNPHMMVLNDPILLTFKELVDKFSDRLFGTSGFLLDVDIVEVSNEEFAKRFMDDTVFVDSNCHKLKTHMPHDAIYPYAVSMLLQKTQRYTDSWNSIRNALNGNDYGSEEYNDLWEFYMKLVQAACSAVEQACYKVLEPWLKDMRFCYQEISDSYRGCCINENPFDQTLDSSSIRRHKNADAEDIMQQRKCQTFYDPLDQPHDECLVDARIKLLEKLNGPFKFKRVFSNH